MVKLRQPVAPFGDVNVLKHPGHIEVVVSVLMVPAIEGAQVAIALDSAAAMRPLYENVAAGGIFGRQPPAMSVIVKNLGTFLSSFAGEGHVHLVYYGCGPQGAGVEPMGTPGEQELASMAVKGPQAWGPASKLCPLMEHLMQSLDPQRWTLVIVVTNGHFQDLAAVKQYSRQIGVAVANGQRAFTKFMLLGVGNEIAREPMEELDDMFEGQDAALQDSQGNAIDLWCHKIAADMQKIEEIFAEIVSENTIVAPQGRILDHRRQEVARYTDGLPGKLRFQLPLEATGFTMEYPGGEIFQDISSALASLA